MCKVRYSPDTVIYGHAEPFPLSLVTCKTLTSYIEREGAMAYPGDGYKMSNYGHKTYTPEQTKEQWRESCTREHRITDTHTRKRRASGDLDLPADTAENYFNTRKTHESVSSYDRSFRTAEGYCQTLKRDDLEHTQVYTYSHGLYIMTAVYTPTPHRGWMWWVRSDAGQSQC